MQSLFAFGLMVVLSTGVSAQFRSAGRVVPSPSGPALGGNFATHGRSYPLGGVSGSPLFPHSGLNGRYGGRALANRSRGFYYGPIFYIPNAFDSPYYEEAAAPPPPNYSAQPPASVIINQYFSTPRPDEGVSQSEENGAATAFQPAGGQPAHAGDLIGPPQNYYLIAYKNHEVYTALAYWFEDRTLHYVTTQNTHNQASLDLIDIDRTTKLNSDRSAPFSISPR